MTTNYAGVDTFYPNLDLITDADAPRAQPVRVPSERLLDNTVHLRNRVVVLEADAYSMQMRHALALREKAAAFDDTTSEQMGAVTLFAAENAVGEVIAIKAGQALRVFDTDSTTDFTSTIPDLTTVNDAAVDANGLIVAVGATTPFNVYKTLAGSWTAGGTLGSEGRRVVYSPAYEGFFAARTSSATVYRSVDATSWAAAATGLTAAHELAVIGAGPGAGRVVCLGTNSTPVFSRSTDDGATFDLQVGTVPDAGSASGPGSLAGCPLVTRSGLNQYVYHVGRYPNLVLSRSADGETWESGPTIEPPAFMSFSEEPRLLICKSTGLFVIVVRGGTFRNLLYFSRDFATWGGPLVSDVALGATAAYQVAGGRLLATENAKLFASDGL